jgi:hypothetical protein
MGLNVRGIAWGRLGCADWNGSVNVLQRAKELAQERLRRNAWDETAE